MGDKRLLQPVDYTGLFRLNERVAVVTGALGHLGKYFCVGLAQCGANVAVVDLDAKVAAEFAADLENSYKTRAIGIGCDVSSPESVEAMVKSVVEAFGEVHILHNNAATKTSDLNAFFAPFEDYCLSTWKEIMAVNIDGMFLVAQAVGKQMIRQGKGGSIIQTSSIYGVEGADHRIYEGSFHLGLRINTPAAYAASKAAVIGLTRHLATYWAEHGIRVNTISPGGVEGGQNDRFKTQYGNRVPLRRMARADEVVGALLYLASDASSYVTGQNILVDGGLSAW